MGLHISRADQVNCETFSVTASVLHQQSVPFSSLFKHLSAVIHITFEFQIGLFFSLQKNFCYQVEKST